VPELPEVEALALDLSGRLTDRAIVKVHVAAFSALKTFDPPLQALEGTFVEGVSRHGKFLDISASGLHLVLHLARAGWVRWRDEVPALPARPNPKNPLAARIVIDEMPRARFLIIGHGRLHPELVALSSELRMTANVHFTGMRSDIARLLCAIDVFALTSVSECFPIALLEAMACGRPAVCTAVGGIPEILNDGETGYLVPPKDPQQLAVRLLDLLSDPRTARRMGRAGRDRVEAEFSLDRSVEMAQRALEDVVMGQHMPSGRKVMK